MLRVAAPVGRRATAVRCRTAAVRCRTAAVRHGAAAVGLPATAVRRREVSAGVRRRRQVRRHGRQHPGQDLVPLPGRQRGDCRNRILRVPSRGAHPATGRCHLRQPADLRVRGNLLTGAEPRPHRLERNPSLRRVIDLVRKIDSAPAGGRKIRGDELEGRRPVSPVAAAQVLDDGSDEADTLVFGSKSNEVSHGLGALIRILEGRGQGSHHREVACPQVGGSIADDAGPGRRIGDVPGIAEQPPDRLRTQWFAEGLDDHRSFPGLPNAAGGLDGGEPICAIEPRRDGLKRLTPLRPGQQVQVGQDAMGKKAAVSQGQARHEGDQRPLPVGPVPHRRGEAQCHGQQRIIEVLRNVGQRQRPVVGLPRTLGCDQAVSEDVRVQLETDVRNGATADGRRLRPPNRVDDLVLSVAGEIGDQCQEPSIEVPAFDRGPPARRPFAPHGWAKLTRQCVQASFLIVAPAMGEITQHRQLLRLGPGRGDGREEFGVHGSSAQHGVEAVGENLCLLARIEEWQQARETEEAESRWPQAGCSSADSATEVVVQRRRSQSEGAQRRWQFVPADEIHRPPDLVEHVARSGGDRGDHVVRIVECMGEAKRVPDERRPLAFRQHGGDADQRGGRLAFARSGRVDRFVQQCRSLRQPEGQPGQSSRAGWYVRGSARCGESEWQQPLRQEGDQLREILDSPGFDARTQLPHAAHRHDPRSRR